MFRHRWLIALAAIATALTLVAADSADARVGGRGSFGSRGARTFSAPAATPTAPSAAPIQRSVTQPNRPATAAAGAQAARPGLFGGGLLGGLAAGFIGAGLFGLLFGHGLFGGMGGLASIIGLLLQVLLVVFVARLAFAWWQRRNQPAYAGAGAGAGAGGPANGPSQQAFNPLGGMFGGGAAQAASEPITIGPSDYDAFERLLGEIQTAYSAEDLGALRAHVSPELLSYFSDELSANASRGLVNRVSDVKLLQGDLSEAWREGGTEYATVAMRFALTDSMVERASGRTVEGGSPEEATELWTFMRARGGDWILSAIQQG
jgi:predicted lipid-binding transport protein (Tim44 family)